MSIFDNLSGSSNFSTFNSKSSEFSCWDDLSIVDTDFFVSIFSFGMLNSSVISSVSFKSSSLSTSSLFNSISSSFVSVILKY